MLVYRTSRGLARGDGDDLLLLDVAERDVAALIAVGRNAIEGAPVRERVAISDVEILAPVEARGRIILNGLNYVDHITEGKMRMPDSPTFLDINDDGLCSPYSDIVLPAEAPTQVDYEGELVLLVTRAGWNIPASEVWNHIGGVTIGNDVSARDVQMAGVDDGRLVRLDQVRRGKTFPTFKPVGPAVLVVDPSDPPVDLHLQTRVNGEVRQDARTSDMMFDVPTFIEHVSRKHALEVGDLIFSGTPSGVGLADGRFLAAGDVVEISIERIGLLRNRVRSAEPT